MKTSALCLLFLLLLLILISHSRGRYSREIRYLSHLNTVDFVKHFGYPCETHKVITEDGYILTMHRVPNGKNETIEMLEENETRKKPVAFLQHGIISFSGDWFTTGPGKSLGFLLADQGYDVWLGNARGNIYSRAHLEYKPDEDSQFWDFSFHEIGYYDLPAMIDYTLNYTEQEKLFYVGHSQGTTASFVLLSEKPEYNKKLIAQFSLSPVAFMSHVQGPSLKFLAFFDKIIEFGLDFFSVNELNYRHPIFSLFFHKFCSTHYIENLCIKEIFSFTGSNKRQFNETLLPIILANFPAGSSTKQFKHFAQEVHSGTFQQYDYGFFRNKLIYGDFTPPQYNLKLVTAPVFLFCSGNDYLSSLKDVKKLYMALPNGQKHVWKVKDPNWNHIDYLWGIQAKQYVYDHIFNAMRQYLS